MILPLLHVTATFGVLRVSPPYENAWSLKP